MHLSGILLSGKRKYLFGLTLLMLLSAIFAAFSMTGSDDFNVARREVLLRRLGHELLLQSGDSTSRVLPVKKIAENEYQLSFEKPFTFQTDPMMNTTRRLLAEDPLTSDYIVNVLNSGNESSTFAFAISQNSARNIITCSKRKQPKASYTVNIKFKPVGMNPAEKGYLLGSLPLLAFVGFILVRTVKPRKSLISDKGATAFTFGPVLFDAQQRQLIINNKTIDLTGTETRLMLIFASSPNETIERSRLQKEIWEDEGVIVGRSLDMFISKLRKKLELASDINIVVIRGKGYKLEISR